MTGSVTTAFVFDPFSIEVMADPDHYYKPLRDHYPVYYSDQRALSDEEIADQLVCAMVGGMEAVPKVTARGIMELWQRPDRLDAIRADLDKNLPVEVQEIVRFCAPAQYTFRTAHRDVMVAGQQIKAGQRVASMLYSAARDEREFNDPDEFIWNRSIPRVISFGLGQHHCIGKHLALLEVKTLIQEFLSQVDSVQFLLEQAGRNAGYFQRGWISLPVVVGLPPMSDFDDA